MTPIDIHMPKCGDNLETMDKEVERITKMFAGLKEQRNDFLPLFRLPNELLTDILYRYLYGHLRDYESPISAPLASLLGVSRRIRALAFGCSKLWSLVDFRFRESAEKMLSVAGTAPLVLRMFHHTHAFDADHLSAQWQILHSVSQNVERLRELHVLAPEWELTKLYATLDQSQPTTIPLTSLRIECMTRDSPPISKCLINCSAPELSEVRISSVDFPLDSPLLGSALRHLELSGTRQGGRPLSAILDGLRNLPNLHTLILRNYLPTSSPSEIQSIKAFRPPQLKFLQLVDDVEACAQLLDHMEVHHPTHVDLTCNIEAGQEAIIHPFLAAFSLGGESGWIRTVALSVGCYGRVESVLAWPTDSPQASDTIETSTMGQPPLSVKFAYQYRPATSDSEPAGVLSCGMRLDKLRTLATNGCNTWSEVTWGRAFQQCTNLTCLVVSGADLDSLLKALFVRFEGKAQFMVKKLERLALHGIDAVGEGSRDTVKSVMLDRRLLGAPLKELRLIGCSGFTEEDRLLLEELVPKLHWDVKRRSRFFVPFGGSF